MLILGRYFRLWVKIVDSGTKLSILYQNYRKFRFRVKWSRISIWVKIVKNVDFGSKLSKVLYFGKNCQKFQLLVKIVEYVDLKTTLSKISILR